MVFCCTSLYILEIRDAVYILCFKLCQQKKRETCHNYIVCRLLLLLLSFNIDMCLNNNYNINNNNNANEHEHDLCDCSALA